MIKILINERRRQSLNLSCARPAFESFASFLRSAVGCHGNQNDAEDQANNANDDAYYDEHASPFLVTLVLRGTVMTTDHAFSILVEMAVVRAVQLITTALSQAGRFVAAARGGHVRATVERARPNHAILF